MQLRVLYYEDKRDPQWTQIKLKNKVFWWFKGHTMFGFSVFSFHFLLSCFMLLVSSCPDPQSCGYLGEISFPFTTSSDPKCGFQIKGCDELSADKEISLTDNNSCIIDSIFNIPPSDPDDHLSIFIRCSDFDVTFAPEQLKKPFKIVNNTTFTGCFRNSYDNESPKMFLYRHCPYHHDIYVSLYSAFDYSLPMPILPFPCLLFEFLHTNYSTCPSYTFLFSVLEIKLEIDKNCTQCLPPLRHIQFEEGQRLSCVCYPHEASHTLPPSSPPHPDTSKAKKIGLYVGIPILVAAVIIGLAVILLLCKGRKIYSGLQKESRRAASVSFRNTTTRESGGVYFGIPVFSYEELQEATNNFDQARELGQGGFGTVYYGTIRDGREVAVKRLLERNYRPVESFINEIQILKRLRHRNLVSLYGCTSRHSRELLLVYEYIPNGTVSSHLYGEQANPSFLPWPLRMKIAIETASALAYLHASDIIHRDVKTSNILLDSEFGVKVSDFGLSRLFPDDVTHVSTAPKGTPGYVDPDYGLCYQLTTKSDVYSFGVVLVELISSLKAVDMNRNREDIKLANLAIRKIQKGAFYELVDPSLAFQSDEKLKSMICSVAELAFQCLQGDKELRPSMGEVLEVLERIHSGRDEPPNQKEIVVHGATRASQSYAHPPLPKTLMSPQQHLHKTY